MHLIHFMLLATLRFALASSRDELPSTTDLTRGNDILSLSKPFCPGSEADERLQSHLFAQFVQTLYVEKNVSKAFDTYVSSNIIEHDPYDTQNRTAIVARLSRIIPPSKVTILRSNFGNNTGFIHLKVAEHPEPLALADIYRMHGTCIVEHWDVAQARPANATNPIAMF